MVGGCYVTSGGPGGFPLAIAERRNSFSSNPLTPFQKGGKELRGRSSCPHPLTQFQALLVRAGSQTR